MSEVLEILQNLPQEKAIGVPPTKPEGGEVYLYKVTDCSKEGRSLHS